MNLGDENIENCQANTTKMETLKYVGFVVKRYAVRKAKIRLYAVHKLKMTQYARGRGFHPH